MKKIFLLLLLIPCLVGAQNRSKEDQEFLDWMNGVNKTVSVQDSLARIDSVPRVRYDKAIRRLQQLDTFMVLDFQDLRNHFTSTTPEKLKTDIARLQHKHDYINTEIDSVNHLPALQNELLRKNYNEAISSWCNNIREYYTACMQQLQSNAADLKQRQEIKEIETTLTNLLLQEFPALKLFMK